MKITIEIDGDYSAEQVQEAIEAAQQALKPKPDKKGRCKCGNKAQWVTVSDWAGGDYCSRCGGSYY